MQKITLRQFAGIALVSTLALATASAQTAPQNQTPKPPEPAVQRPTPPDPAGQPTNIKLDFTITDQTGPGEPTKKVVTMVVSDRGNGSIRSSGSVRAQGRVQINVDASPVIHPSARSAFGSASSTTRGQSGAMDPRSRPRCTNRSA